MSEHDWRHQAACKDADPEVFTPEHPTKDAIDAAVANYCDQCPVRLECKTEARNKRGSWNPDGTYGIWGGLWYGPKPAELIVTKCQWCGTSVEGRTTRTRYCGSVCRAYAARARRLAEELSA